MSAVTSMFFPKQPKVPAATPAPTSNSDEVEEARRKERMAAQLMVGRSALDVTRGSGGSSAPVLKSQLGA